MSTKDDVLVKASKPMKKKTSFKSEEIIHYDEKQSKTEYIDEDAELLRKLGISFDDDNDDLTPTMSLMSLASASPVDSTGDKAHTKSTSTCDFTGGTSYEDVDYTEYDFDYEEEVLCNTKYDFRIYRDILEEIPVMEKKKYKNGTRSSLTFSNQRVMEIERDNRILLQKIMQKGPSGDSLLKQKQIKNQRPKMKSAAEVNRRKQQQQIIYENQILKRKLDKIASRRASISN